MRQPGYCTIDQTTRYVVEELSPFRVDLMWWTVYKHRLMKITKNIIHVVSRVITSHMVSRLISAIHPSCKSQAYSLDWHPNRDKNKFTLQYLQSGSRRAKCSNQTSSDALQHFRMVLLCGRCYIIYQSWFLCQSRDNCRETEYFGFWNKGQLQRQQKRWKGHLLIIRLYFAIGQPRQRPCALRWKQISSNSDYWFNSLVNAMLWTE